MTNNLIDEGNYTVRVTALSNEYSGQLTTFGNFNMEVQHPPCDQNYVSPIGNAFNLEDFKNYFYLANSQQLCTSSFQSTYSPAICGQYQFQFSMAMNSTAPFIAIDSSILNITTNSSCSTFQFYPTSLVGDYYIKMGVSSGNSVIFYYINYAQMSDPCSKNALKTSYVSSRSSSLNLANQSSEYLTYFILFEEGFYQNNSGSYALINNCGSVTAGVKFNNGSTPDSRYYTTSYSQITYSGEPLFYSRLVHNLSVTIHKLPNQPDFYSNYPTVYLKYKISLPSPYNNVSEIIQIQLTC